MTLQDVLRAIDSLSPQEVETLRVYLMGRVAAPTAPDYLSVEERIRRLDAVAYAIRDGFSGEAWSQIEHDMNAEIIEPWDETAWIP